MVHMLRSSLALPTCSLSRTTGSIATGAEIFCRDPQCLVAFRRCVVSFLSAPVTSVASSALVSSDAFCAASVVPRPFFVSEWGSSSVALCTSSRGAGCPPWSCLGIRFSRVATMYSPAGPSCSTGLKRGAAPEEVVKAFQEASQRGSMRRLSRLMTRTDLHSLLGFHLAPCMQAVADCCSKASPLKRPCRRRSRHARLKWQEGEDKSCRRKADTEVERGERLEGERRCRGEKNDWRGMTERRTRRAGEDQSRGEALQGGPGTRMNARKEVSRSGRETVAACVVGVGNEEGGKRVLPGGAEVGNTSVEGEGNTCRPKTRVGDWKEGSRVRGERTSGRTELKLGVNAPEAASTDEPRCTAEDLRFHTFWYRCAGRLLKGEMVMKVRLPVLAQICEALAKAGVLLFQTVPYRSLATPAVVSQRAQSLSVPCGSDEEAGWKPSESRETQSPSRERARVTGQTGASDRNVWVIHRFYFRLLDRLLVELYPRSGCGLAVASSSLRFASGSQRGSAPSVPGTVGQDPIDRPFPSVCRGGQKDVSEAGDEVPESLLAPALDLPSIARVIRAVCVLQRKSVSDLENRLEVEVESLRRCRSRSDRCFECRELRDAEQRDDEQPCGSVAEAAGEETPQKKRLRETKSRQKRVGGRPREKGALVRRAADHREQSVTEPSAVETRMGDVETKGREERAAGCAGSSGPVTEARSSAFEGEAERRTRDLSEQLHQAQWFFVFFFEHFAGGLLAAMFQKPGDQVEKAPAALLSPAGVVPGVQMEADSSSSFSPFCPPRSPPAFEYAAGGARPANFAKLQLDDVCRVQGYRDGPDCWEGVLSPRFLLCSNDQFISLLLAFATAARLVCKNLKAYQILRLYRPVPTGEFASPPCYAPAFGPPSSPSPQSSCPTSRAFDTGQPDSGSCPLRSGDAGDKPTLPFLVPYRIQPFRLHLKESQPVGFTEAEVGVLSRAKCVAVSFSSGMTFEPIGGAGGALATRGQSPSPTSLSSTLLSPGPPATSSPPQHDGLQSSSLPSFSMSVSSSASIPVAGLPSRLNAALATLSSLILVEQDKLPQAAALGLYVQLSRCPFDVQVASQVLLRECFSERRMKEGRGRGLYYSNPFRDNEASTSLPCRAPPSSTSFLRTSALPWSVSSCGPCSLHRSSRGRSLSFSQTFVLHEWHVVMRALLHSLLQQPSGLLRELPARDIPSFMFALVHCLPRLNALASVPSCSSPQGLLSSSSTLRRSLSFKDSTRTSTHLKKLVWGGGAERTRNHPLLDDADDYIASSGVECPAGLFPRVPLACPGSSPRSKIEHATAALLPVLARRLAFEQHRRGSYLSPAAVSDALTALAETQCIDGAQGAAAILVRRALTIMWNATELGCRGRSYRTTVPLTQQKTLCSSQARNPGQRRLVSGYRETTCGNQNQGRDVTDSIVQTVSRGGRGDSKQCLQKIWVGQGQVLKALLLPDGLRVSLCRITNAALKLGMLENGTDSDSTAPSAQFFSCPSRTRAQRKASRGEAAVTIARGDRWRLEVPAEEEANGARKGEIANEKEILSGQNAEAEAQRLTGDEIEKFRLLVAANLSGMTSTQLQYLSASLLCSTAFCLPYLSPRTLAMSSDGSGRSEARKRQESKTVPSIREEKTEATRNTNKNSAAGQTFSDNRYITHPIHLSPSVSDSRMYTGAEKRLEATAGAGVNLLQLPVAFACLAEALRPAGPASRDSCTFLALKLATYKHEIAFRQLQTGLTATVLGLCHYSPIRDPLVPPASRGDRSSPPEVSFPECPLESADVSSVDSAKLYNSGHKQLFRDTVSRRRCSRRGKEEQPSEKAPWGDCGRDCGEVGSVIPRSWPFQRQKQRQENQGTFLKGLGETRQTSREAFKLCGSWTDKQKTMLELLSLESLRICWTIVQRISLPQRQHTYEVTVSGPSRVPSSTVSSRLAGVAVALMIRPLRSELSVLTPAVDDRRVFPSSSEFYASTPST
ncbi:hypothetical protein CSUI_000097 [Cystoisospora suis]|uniref:Uncharacterized protein n=1 Tax=Cystoisospora suis TaxID=483139 RepID=A0A2C6LI56_9APIC|nr:hypothetical protein CSUI_000097 [Cystoisospora suis]